MLGHLSVIRHRWLGDRPYKGSRSTSVDYGGDKRRPSQGQPIMSAFILLPAAMTPRLSS